MAKLLDVLYDKVEETLSNEAKNVSDFHDRFASSGEAEELFSVAIHDAQKIAFCEGMKAAIQLFAELHIGWGGGGAKYMSKAMTVTALVAVANELAQKAKDALPKLREKEKITQVWYNNGIYYRETSFNGKKFLSYYDFQERKAHLKIQ